MSTIGEITYRSRHRLAAWWDKKWTKARWSIAGKANRLPWFCWADLVDWSLHNRTRAKDRFPLPSRVTSCREDAARSGSCWCAKFQTCAFQVKYPQVTPGIVVPASTEGEGS
jgi:hypothetical protein